MEENAPTAKLSPVTFMLDWGIPATARARVAARAEEMVVALCCVPPRM